MRTSHRTGKRTCDKTNLYYLLISSTFRFMGAFGMTMEDELMAYRGVIVLTFSMP